MPIKQVAYEIPADLTIGILKGAYKRFGGVVRDAKTGKIIKHLKEVDVPKKKASGALIQSIKSHPVAAISVGVVASVGIGIAGYCVKRKQDKKYKRTLPKCVVNFDNSLKKYLKAVRNGKLEEKNIDDLMKNLDEIMNSQASEQISLELSNKELKQLVNVIYNYTKKLAKTNLIKLEDFKQSSPNSINNLHNYLEIQKQIFKQSV